MTGKPSRSNLRVALAAASPSKPERISASQWIHGYSLFVLVLATWLCSLAGLWLFDGLLSWTAGLIYIVYDTCLLGYVAWQTRSLRPPAAGAAGARAETKHLTLSVIVAARNEREILPVCLRALQAQSDAPDEILVVDDGSTDDTRQVLKQAFGLVDSADGCTAEAGALRVWHKSHSGKPHSLNEALTRIGSDLVVTLDADTVLEPGAIAALRAAFSREPTLVAACGVLRPRCEDTAAGRLFEWFQTFEYIRAFLSRVAWMKADALLLVSGAFAGYRRSALLQVGGFLAESRVEDYELIHRMHRYTHDHGLGWTVRVIGEAYAETDAPATLRSFLRQRRRWFAGFLETQQANRDMTGNASYGAVGRFMLPIKLIDTLQPVFGLTAFVLLLYFIVCGLPVLGPVFLVILAKLIIDIAFHVWSVHLYHRWLDRAVPRGAWAQAVAAAFAEPFSFQLLRHSGALLGWGSFLSGQTDWTPPRSLTPPITESP